MTEHPDKLDLHSQNISEEKKQELLRLFPEIHTEGGKVDFERLKLGTLRDGACLYVFRMIDCFYEKSKADL